MNSSPTDFAPWRGVFETLRVIDGKPLFFVEHRTELARAMDALGLTTQVDFVDEASALPMKSGRWRWIVTANETRTRFEEERSSPVDAVTLSVSPVRVGSQNWDARFKTLSYLAHAQAFETASTQEVVLLNEHGHVASAARSNIFWRRGEKLFTPAHEAGCRCGVVRKFILQQGNVVQGDFLLAELLEADEIFLTNSMKGVVSVRERAGRSLDAFPTANAMREAYGIEMARMLENRLPVRHW
jgi:4-amino-4-deoxychorismate lyase